MQVRDGMEGSQKVPNKNLNLLLGSGVNKGVVVKENYAEQQFPMLFILDRKSQFVKRFTVHVSSICWPIFHERNEYTPKDGSSHRFLACVRILKCSSP